jgi:ATP-dependent DNA ligase I
LKEIGTKRGYTRREPLEQGRNGNSPIHRVDTYFTADFWNRQHLLEMMPQERARFTGFAEVCEQLARTTKKLEKRALIASYLRELYPSQAALAAQYLAGLVFPETSGRILNVAGALLQKAVQRRSSASPEAMHAAYLRHGDLGVAAADLLPHEIPAVLTLHEVQESLDHISEVRGIEGKNRYLLELLERTTPLEAKYLIKLMLGDMRIGVKQSLVEEAIAEAYQSEISAVRRATMLLGDLQRVVRLAAEQRLSEARMQLFHPLGFMLASPVASVQEAMERFAEEITAEHKGKSEALANSEQIQKTSTKVVPEQAVQEAQFEDKYDGIRCQLHAGDPNQPGRVALFSRSKENMTVSFPELVSAFKDWRQPLILDGEILAWSKTEDRALPFSSLQQRLGRKRVTEAMQRDIPVVFMAFDVLYVNGELVLDRSLRERRALLEQAHAANAEQTIVSTIGEYGQKNLFVRTEERVFPRLKLAPAVQLENAEQLETAYVEARSRGNEGVMLKALHSVYQPGRRGLAWLKLKRELATLDVVVTAAEYGHGKRAGVLSDYTFAVRDGEQLRNVGKAYSGLTDSEIDELSKWFQEHTIEDFGFVRSVEPKVILEVAFNNLMRSGRHDSGFALRFPRILRIRRDKPVEEVDTLQRVEEIYASQPDKPVEA